MLRKQGFVRGRQGLAVLGPRKLLFTCSSRSKPVWNSVGPLTSSIIATNDSIANKRPRGICWNVCMESCTIISTPLLLKPAIAPGKRHSRAGIIKVDNWIFVEGGLAIARASKRCVLLMPFGVLARLPTLF